MGWFGEQIQQRKNNDNIVFSEALYDIAGSVMGKKLFFETEDSRKIIKNEIDEILKFYHLKSRELPDSIKEIDKQLEFLFRPYGIMKRSVKLKGEWYREAVCPMLAMRTDNENVTALIPDKSSGYSFIDRNLGKKVRVTKSNADMFEADAFCFYKPFPQKILTEKDLFKYVCDTIPKRDIVILGIFAFLALIIGTFIPMLYNIIFDSVIYQDSLKPLFAAAVFLSCVSISMTIMKTLKNLMTEKIKNRMRVSVEAAVMMRVLSLPANVFKKHSAGELSDRVQSVSELCEMISEAMIAAGLSTLFSAVYIVQICIYAPMLSVEALIIIAAVILFSVVIAYIQMDLKKKQIEKNSQEQGMVYALISGIQKIKLVGAEKRAFSRWGNLYAENVSLRYDPPFILKIKETINAAITIIGAVVIYYTAVKTNISVSDFYTFNSAYGIVSGVFIGFSGTMSVIAGIRPVFESIKLFFDAEPEISSEKEVISRISGSIELNGVSFRYDDNMPNVIDNLSIKIRSGEYVAIVGTTGCGKSTLMRLMLGFEKAQKGAVYFDGKDLTTLDLKSLRQKIGVVMQDGRLFQGDIFSNIAVASSNLNLEQAWEAAEMAGIAEDIRNMPMGMNTIISEGSGGISGGQRQRILIARAIASKPKILMFDEATSALDNITQKIVSDSLDKLKCTRIVIAHRLSTIKQCGRIIFLEKGRIVEEGTYDELIEKNGLFNELVSRQRVV